MQLLIICYQCLERLFWQELTAAFVHHLAIGSKALEGVGAIIFSTIFTLWKIF